MPHVLVAGEEYVMSVFCQHAGQASVNRQRLQISGSAAPVPTDQDLADDICTNWGAQYKLMLTSDSKFDGVTLHMVKGAVPFPRTAFSIIAAGVGGQAPPVLPTQTSGLLSLNTRLAGRKYRGRLYMPFPAAISQDLVTGEPIALYKTHLAGVGTLLVNGGVVAVGGGTATYIFGLNPAGGGGFEFYESALVHAAWATQKRRGDFGKLNKPPF